MRNLKVAVVAAALMACLGGVASYAHQPDMSDGMLAYVKRDGLMHLINSQRYILIQMLVGQREVNQEEFVRAARSLEALFSMIPGTFEDNGMADYSRAKPEIWENWDDFVAKAEEFRRIAEDIATSAEESGAEASLEKVRLFNCGSCHDPYRK
jgi:cytochrome c556